MREGKEIRMNRRKEGGGEEEEQGHRLVKANRESEWLKRRLVKEFPHTLCILVTGSFDRPDEIYWGENDAATLHSSLCQSTPHPHIRVLYLKIFQRSGVSASETISRHSTITQREKENKLQRIHPKWWSTRVNSLNWYSQSCVFK